ncbi:MAG: hypothetical protein E6X72_21555 [Clostridioides difficile]|nr:hypothetical protein [Clostridioides difficile]MDU5206295.1 hypothetical protein [Clostridioides difficile]
MSKNLERNLNELVEWEDHVTEVNATNMNAIRNRVISNSESINSVKTDYQQKSDSNLITSNKKIVGAINELKNGSFDKVTISGKQLKFYANGTEKFNIVLPIVDIDLNPINTALGTKYDNVEISGQDLKFYVGRALKKTINIPTVSGENGKEIELRKSETHIEWNYVGESNWKQLITLSELKVKGADGKNGTNGITPNITIGEVTTLEAGQQATVTKSGTNEAPIFNFGIPKGQNGVNGQSPDLSGHQTKRDETLRTTDKTVVGSINEIFQKVTTLESKLNEALNKIAALESKHPES